MKLLELSRITAEAAVLTILILAVSRVLLRRLKPGIRYFLWIFVALRILVPVRIEFLPEVPDAFGFVERYGQETAAEELFRESAVFGEKAERTETEAGKQGWKAGGQAENAAPEETGIGAGQKHAEQTETVELQEAGIGAGQKHAAQAENVELQEAGIGAGQKHAEQTETAASEEAKQGEIAARPQATNTVRHLLILLWLAGAAAMAIYFTANNIRLSMILKVGRKRAGTLPNGIPLYHMPGYNCLAGVFSPAVYADMDGLKDPDVIENVIRHELQHLRAGDPYWQLLRVICLILQWHNPFVWWAYFASRQDGELACDAGVVRKLSPQARYRYGESLLAAAACVCRDRPAGSMASSAGGARRFLEKRVKGILQDRRGYGACLSVLVVCILGVACFGAFRETAFTAAGENQRKDTDKRLSDTDNRDSSLKPAENGQTEVTADSGYRVELDIGEHYITNTGTPFNLYYIDEDQVLWGCGENFYGQLGQGTEDFDFHKDMVKIAENVIHVDCSQNGFTIYLTADHKLYGMGNGGSGALPRYEKEEWMKHVNREAHNVTEPCLLMEDVAYARCGRSDVACMKNDDSVWVFGVVGYGRDREVFYPYPEKVLENAALVTGGSYNHAALLQDGSLWTWGDNYAGNCGTTGVVVPVPTLVAQDVAMVWTGRMSYQMDCRDIRTFKENFEREYENTVIMTKDGSYYICGANVGTEKTLPIYYEAGNYPLVYSEEFLPWKR